jgi:hypothetical protein
MCYSGMKNYYTVLQIPDSATRPDIQAAYRRLAKKFHPDVNKSEDAHEKFCEITEAYDFLMNHWPGQIASYTDPKVRDKKYETYHESEEYRRFRQEARERAQKQAKMRYEKFKQQHEAFQTSGINDLALLLKIAARTAGILLFFLLFLLPVLIAIQHGWIMILLIIFTWPFAGILGWYVYDNRKNYFIPGKFYYSPQRIRHLFIDVHSASQPCYFCPVKPADSVPYKLELFKLKDLKLSSGGFRQHNVNYINKSVSTLIPRSRKAFILHSVSAMIKALALLLCFLFLPLSSFVWRFIAGLAAGGLISSLLLMITRTRSNVSYLLSYGMICRISLWIFFISLASQFRIDSLNIVTSDSIQFVVTAIFIFDCLIMQLLDLVLGRIASRPLVRQYPEVSQKLESGYNVYNDIPVISVVYPMLKWLFG